MTRWARAGLVVAPAVVLAGLGITHPTDLTAATAPWWTTMHLLALPVFPLLAVSLWLLLRGMEGPLAWVARIAGYGYAAFYTGLDLLAGVGTGAVVQNGVDPDSSAVTALFATGNDLGDIGAWSFLVAVMATAIALVQRSGRRALLGAVVLFGGAVVFMGAHIYWPDGVLSMVALAVGLGLLTALPPAPAPGASATSRSVTQGA